MYSKEQITFLLSGGFTLDEIMQMQAPDEGEHSAPAQDPQPDGKPAGNVEKPVPPEQPVQPVLNPGAQSQVDQLIASVNQLVGTIQRNNINGMQFGSPVPDRTVDDILAEVINPPQKK